MNKKFWFKLHLILGLSAGFILMIVGFSGALLSFEKEILKVINKDSYLVKIEENRLSTKELLEKFQQQMPQAKINGLTIYSDSSQSVSINVAGEGANAKRGITYYVNPYTAEILPALKGEGFFKTVENLHRRLLLDDIGKQIVGASTLLLVVLLFSGVYLYFPRIKRTFIASFTFSFKSKGRYFLHSMHSAIGMWVIPFYLIAILTGLYWSYDWYNQALHKISGVEKVQKQQMPNNQDKKNEQQKEQKPTFVEIDKAVNMFDIFVENCYSNVTLRFPQNGSVYSFNYLSKDASHEYARDTLELDIKSWQLIKHDKYKDKSMNQKIMKSIFALHTGKYFGILGQVGMFLASLMLPLFAITGLMLYLSRKNKKKRIQ